MYSRKVSFAVIAFLLTGCSQDSKIGSSLDLSSSVNSPSSVGNPVTVTPSPTPILNPTVTPTPMPTARPSPTTTPSSTPSPTATPISSPVGSGGTVINCPNGFYTNPNVQQWSNNNNSVSGSCGIAPNGATGAFWNITNTPSNVLSEPNPLPTPNSSQLVGPYPALLAANWSALNGQGHNSFAIIYQTQVNVQAFTTSFTFQPNGVNFSLIFEDNTANSTGSSIVPSSHYAAGAGLEGGIEQFAGMSNTITNNYFALNFSQESQIASGESYGSYQGSTVQIYQTLQAPYNPLYVGSQYSFLSQYATNKIQTTPVQMNNPANTGNSVVTTNGTVDTYSATVVYDGYNFTLNLYDITAGGSCPGSSCFTYTWNGVYIPSIVGETSAYVGFVAGTNTDTVKSSANPSGSILPYPMTINSFVYTAQTPKGAPPFTAWNANSTYPAGGTLALQEGNSSGGSLPANSAASPVFSVAPGSYQSTQTVTLTTSSGANSYICYEVVPGTTSNPPALFPQPANYITATGEIPQPNPPASNPGMIAPQSGCTVGTLYSGPIKIPLAGQPAGTYTLYAMASYNMFGFPLATANGGPPSTLVAGTYTISNATSEYLLDSIKLLAQNFLLDFGNQ